MAFHVFPDPPTAPFSAAAAGAGGDASNYQAVPELNNLTPEAGKPTFFVRVACSGAAGTGPAVWLKVRNTATGTRAEGEISAAHNTTNPAQIGDGTNEGVVNALYVGPDEHNVTLVSVYAFVPGLAFEVKVQNRDAEPRDLVWVVATTEQESQQPWIHAKYYTDVPSEIPPDSGASPLRRFQHTFRIPVANWGTGPLNITEQDFGHYLTLKKVDAIAPNSNDVMQVDFDYGSGMSDDWAYEFGYRLDSNDSMAMEGFQHNNLIKIGTFSEWQQTMTSSSPAPSATAEAKGEPSPAQPAREKPASAPDATSSQSSPTAEEQPARKRKSRRKPAGDSQPETKGKPAGD